MGKIFKVYDEFAKVMFVTSDRFKIPAVSVESGYQFVANGNGRNGMKLLFASNKPMQGGLVSSTIGKQNIPIGYFDQETNSVIPVNKKDAVNFVTVLLDE